MPSQPKPLYKGREKYTPNVARNYEQNRKPATHRAEMELLDRVLEIIPRQHWILDLPCGGGRVTRHLVERGYQVIAGDVSDSMKDLARNNLQDLPTETVILNLDIERIALTDRSVDTLLCFRLFHHFPDPATRQRAIAEMCRVTDRFVVLSYFSPLAITSFKRQLRFQLTGRTSQKYATSLAEISSYFAPLGFRLRANFARLPWLHTLHVALFERDERFLC